MRGFCDLSAEFRHCFFAVRMGIRLGLNLRAAPAPAATLPRREAEYERPETERAEPDDHHDPADRRDPVESDRERDREYEPVSLPQFLKSLGVAADAAERRRAELPSHVMGETLPRLRTLLADAGAAPSPTAAQAARGAPLALLMRPPPAAPAAARAHLLGSAAPPTAPPRQRSG